MPHSRSRNKTTDRTHYSLREPVGAAEHQRLRALASVRRAKAAAESAVAALSWAAPNDKAPDDARLVEYDAALLTLGLIAQAEEALAEFDAAARAIVAEGLFRTQRMQTAEA